MSLRCTYTKYATHWNKVIEAVLFSNFCGIPISPDPFYLICLGARVHHGEHFYYGKLKSESVDKDECLFFRHTDLEPNMKSSHSAQRLKAQQLSNTKREIRSFGYISLSPLSCPMSLFNYLRSSPLGLGSPMFSRKQLLQKNQERQRHTGSLQSLPGLLDCSTPHRGRLDNASWASAHSNKNVTLIINYKKQDNTMPWMFAWSDERLVGDDRSATSSECL